MPVVARFIRINLVLLVLFSSALVVWCYFYTGWWGPVSALVGGGGLYGVGTFVWKLLAGEWKTRLRNWALGQVRQPTAGIRLLLVLLNAVLGLILAATFCVGTVVVQSQQKDPVRITFVRHGKESPARVLNLNESLRRVFLAAWVSPAPVSVRAEGLPDQFPRIRPWHKEELVVPDGFLKRPLVLVVPDPSFFILRQKGYSVKVETRELGGQWHPADPFPFETTPFWIGCSGEVRVPTGTLGRLGQLAKIAREKNWPCQVETDLEGVERVRVCLLDMSMEAKPCVEQPVEKDRTQQIEDFPTLVILTEDAG